MNAGLGAPPPAGSRGSAPGLPLPDGLPHPQRAWATATIALGILLAVVDASIANVALPTIAADLHTGASASVWVVNAYQLATVIALLPLASLGEIVGFRRVHAAGFAAFTLASILCAASRTLPELTAARVLQGLGAAGMVSITGALVRFIFPAASLGRGTALTGMMVGTGAALGPPLAGLILSVASWPCLFLINIPFGLLGLAMAPRTLPYTPRSGEPFDFRSASLNTAAFGLGFIGADILARGRFTAGLAALAASAAALYALVRRQLGRPSPLLPVDLLGITAFRMAVLTSVASFLAQSAALVAIPFLLQRHLGRAPAEVGLLMAPWPVASILVAPLVGRLADRLPVWRLCTLGLLINATGLALLATLPAAPTDADIAWRMAIAGAGFTVFQAPNNRAIIRAAPRARAGGASGMLSVARLIGQTLGSLAAAIAFARLGDRGPHVSIQAAALLALAACVLSAARRRDQA